MKKILYIGIAATMLCACTHTHKNDGHEHGESCAHDHAAEAHDHARPNVVHFHDEQQAKIDFAVEKPTVAPFGAVIHTTGQIVASQTDACVLSAKTGGIVVFNRTLGEGQSVSAGQALFTVSGAGMAENNIGVQLAEAQADYRQAETAYQRAQSLAADQIVSAKELGELKSRFESAKAVYDNLTKHFSSDGQHVGSPMGGFVTQIAVANGQYVEAGQTLAVVSRNRSLLVKADVPVRYAAALAHIAGANIQSTDKSKTYSLNDLHGRVLSYGKSIGGGNYQLPVTFEIDNRGDFIAGSFVEVYIQTTSAQPVMTVPATALTEEQGHYFVFVEVGSEEFEKREVRIGATDGLRTEIKAGLQPEETLVSRGAMSVKLAQAAGALDPHAGHVH